MSIDQKPFSFIVFTFLLSPSLIYSMAQRPEPEESVSKYSVTHGEPIPIQSRRGQMPLVVYGDEAARNAPYVPSGYMGDSGSLKVSAVYESAPLASGAPGRTSLKISYDARGKEGWAGIYWQTPANNWGRVKGAGFDLSKAKRLSFWVKGETGGEVIREVMVGGISTGPYPDSAVASIGPLKLKPQWEKYVIKLEGKDLRHIIGGFAFVVRRVDNHDEGSFYLDEIVYEGPTEDPTPEAGPAVQTGTTPVSESLALKSPVRHVIPFSTAFDAMEPQIQNSINDVLRLAKENENSLVVIEGHTDDVGPAKTNLKLSKERANAVAEFLASKGLNPTRMMVIGYGEERPLSTESNATPEGREKNRRVEMVVIPR